MLAEVCGYWGHRWSHEWPWLWRFHKLHHSIETMDWLAPNRRHPVDLVVARVAIALPLLVLGFTVPSLAAPFVVRRFQGLLVHADVRLEGGPLRWFVATPHFHHWHHAADAEGWNRNYAGQVPLVDWMFGTLVMPLRRWPTSYGLGTSERAPAGWLAQLRWPLEGVITQPDVRRQHRSRPALRSSRRSHDDTQATRERSAKWDSLPVRCDTRGEAGRHSQFTGVKGLGARTLPEGSIPGRLPPVRGPSRRRVRPIARLQRSALTPCQH